MRKFTQRLKKSWKSLTVFFNGIVLSLIPLVEYARDNIDQVQQFMKPDTYKWIAMSLVVANIILRFKTTTDLADK